LERVEKIVKGRDLRYKMKRTKKLGILPASLSFLALAEKRRWLITIPYYDKR